MLCECVPIGSNVGGIPTAIGDAGYLVEYNNDIQIAEAIRQALASSPESGKNARDRIASHFNLRQREEALKKVVAELLP
jgi:glycosyltransferase involved in cell wall biosynthesis